MPQLPEPTPLDRFIAKEISCGVANTNAGTVPAAIRPSTEKEDNHQIGEEPKGTDDMVVEKRGPCQKWKQNPDRGNEKDQNGYPSAGVAIFLLGHSPYAKDDDDSFFRIPAQPEGTSPVEKVLIKESQSGIYKG